MENLAEMFPRPVYFITKIPDNFVAAEPENCDFGSWFLDRQRGGEKTLFSGGKLWNFCILATGPVHIYFISKSNG